MVAGKKNWVCTDPDCVQFRREAPEHGHNVFELAQVNHTAPACSASPTVLSISTTT